MPTVLNTKKIGGEKMANNTPDKVVTYEVDLTEMFVKGVKVIGGAREVAIKTSELERFKPGKRKGWNATATTEELDPVLAIVQRHDWSISVRDGSYNEDYQKMILTRGTIFSS